MPCKKHLVSESTYMFIFIKICSGRNLSSLSVRLEWVPSHRTLRHCTKTNEVQSTLVISKSKGPSKTFRDIRTSTYQICSIEEKPIRTTKFHKWLWNLTPLVRNIYWKYCGKGEKLLPRSNFFSYPQYFVTWKTLDFYVETRIRFSLRDKRFFEITEDEITSVDCSWWKGVKLQITSRIAFLSVINRLGYYCTNLK